MNDLKKDATLAKRKGIERKNKERQQLIEKKILDGKMLRHFHYLKEAVLNSAKEVSRELHLKVNIEDWGTIRYGTSGVGMTPAWREYYRLIIYKSGGRKNTETKRLFFNKRVTSVAMLFIAYDRLKNQFTLCRSFDSYNPLFKEELVSLNENVSTLSDWVKNNLKEQILSNIEEHPDSI